MKNWTNGAINFQSISVPELSLNYSLTNNKKNPPQNIVFDFVALDCYYKT